MVARSLVPILIALASLAPASSVGAQSPPKNLRQAADGHWTAWDPPAAVAEGAQVHVVQRGDTLWDLAAKYFSNAYLWPQIWERNGYILDAHWIYPGDPLLLGFDVDSVSSLEQSADEAAGRRGGSMEAGQGVQGGREDSRQIQIADRYGRILRLGTQDDIYCSGYVGNLNEEFPFRIQGSEYEVLSPALNPERRGVVRRRSKTIDESSIDAIKVGLSTGDIVYVGGGLSSGLSPGDLLTVIGPGEPVRHPWTRKVYGRYFAYHGRVRILSVQENSAIAEISQACQPIFVGQTLRAFEQEPVPSERRTLMRAYNDPHSLEQIKNAPVILHAKDGLVTVGQDHVVYLELNSSDGVEPGDIFTVYRRSVRNNPPVVLGEVAVLSVHERSSVAKVIESRYPIYVGDSLVLK